MTNSKPSNAALVERIVRIAPGITRRELSIVLDLSQTTINGVVAAAIGAGVIQEKLGARGDGAVGRPRSGLTFAGNHGSFAFVIWTHGVLRSAVVSFDGAVHGIREERIARLESVPREPDVIRIVGALMERRIEGVDRPSVIVLSVPAPYEHGLRSPVKFRDRFAPQAAGRWFEDEPADVLRARFGVPVIIENDSNLAALGESRGGAGRGAALMIHVRLSDRGIGSALILNGDAVEGADGFAGEISHAQVDVASTTICSCGSRGCLRTLLGPSLLTPLRAAYGDQLTYADLLRLVEAAEPGPVRVLEDAGRSIGVPLAHIITFLNPTVVVVEAGSPVASATVVRGLRDHLNQTTPPFIRDTLNLTAGTLSDRAVYLGALSYARSRAIGMHDVARRFQRIGARIPLAEPGLSILEEVRPAD